MPSQVYTLTANGIAELSLKVSRLSKEISSLSNDIDNTLLSSDYNDQMYLTILEEKNSKKAQLDDLNKILKNSQTTMNINKESHTTVEIGDTVFLQNHVVAHTVTIVSHFEANPAAGKVSSLSPIGSAALGRKLGDLIEVPTPNGIIEFEIMTIS
jgi:transcription elongation factor GreA